jgi:hypothetical protein
MINGKTKLLINANMELKDVNPNGDNVASSNLNNANFQKL